MRTHIIATLAAVIMTAVARAPVASAQENRRVVEATPPISESLVDLNLATEEELIALPGIGPTRAHNIVLYRSRHPFRRKVDLLKISGIGKKTLQSFAARVCAGRECVANEIAPQSPK